MNNANINKSSPIAHLMDFIEWMVWFRITTEVGEDTLVSKYKYKTFDFIETTSHGTKALLLYYYWIQRLKTSSFVFIDDFHAFLHTFPAKELFLEIIQNIESQILITTHNTDFLSNSILHPDCCFIMEDGVIFSLPYTTERELRGGHNPEKMFKSGEFSVR